MEINWNTSLYALIGNPINNSLSPKIHNFILEELKLNSLYMAFNIQEQDLEQAIEGFKAMGVKGFNITIPFKKEIIKYLDSISPEAEIIGAINTVKNQNGKLVGYNTDGLGFLKTFKDNNVDLAHKNILIIGAGGAAYGIACTLANENIESISIANRSVENSLILKEKIESINSNIDVLLDDLNLQKINKNIIDIIINTTSIGMSPEEDKCPIVLDGFKGEIVVYDIIYKPLKTKLLMEAENKGYKTFNGLSMLINQAILAESIWNEIDDEKNKKIFKEIEGIWKFM